MCNSATTTTRKEFAVGAGLDLGLLHQAGDVGPLQDLSWGLAFRGIGLGFTEQSDEYRVYVPPFTLAAGLSVAPLASEDVSLVTRVDLWSPTLQALKLELGVALQIRDFLQLRAHYPVTLFGGEVGDNGPGFRDQRQHRLRGGAAHAAGRRERRDARRGEDLRRGGAVARRPVGARAGRRHRRGQH